MRDNARAAGLALALALTACAVPPEGPTSSDRVPGTAQALGAAPAPYGSEPVANPPISAGAEEATPAATAPQVARTAPSGPRAPDWRSDTWLNSEPLAPEDRLGHVVLVDFWTFGCINCVRTIPAVRTLHETYRDDGLLVVSVHTPEFRREHDLDNVRRELVNLDVPYPVAIDNDRSIWRAFGTRYWPTIYLLDKRGVIRKTHIGELHAGTPAWDEMVAVIEQLQAEEG